MKNTGNAITDAYGHLEQAGIEEEKRTAMVKATLALQQPVLESIEDLASKMDARIDGLASKISELQVDMAKRDTRMARRDIGIIISVITLAIAVVGFILQMQNHTAL